MNSPCLRSGIKSTAVSLSLQQVTVETELPVHVVEDALKTTGLRVTVRGQGSIAGVVVLEHGLKALDGLIEHIYLQVLALALLCVSCRVRQAA